MGLAMGELKVLVDGKEIFSYKNAGRMPNPGEITGLIRAEGKA